MMNLKRINKNYAVIAKICEEYREELTTLSGVMIDQMGGCTLKDYKKFMDSLSIDCFIGNQLTGLMANEIIKYYKQILDDEMTFEEMIEDLFDEDILERWKNNLER